MGKRSLGIASRFALVVVVLVPSLGAVAWAGFHGLQSGRDAVNSLYKDHLLTTRDASALNTGLEDANHDSLQLLVTTDPGERSRVATQLVSNVSRQVDAGIAAVGLEVADDPVEKPRLAAITSEWAKFQQLLAGGTLVPAGTAAADTAVSGQVTAILDPAIAASKSIIDTEEAQANQAHGRALASYQTSSHWMLLALALALLAAAGVVGWLIRSVLPRTLAYSAFAADVTRGDYTKRLEPRGSDELADLGRTLDDLAQRRQVAELYDQRQFEFTDTLQVTETEQEAHNLVKRHLERSVHRSTVTVLNRNNSADRLQAVTAVEPGSPLAGGLESATPRSCLAVRMTRPWHSVHGEDVLLSCPVCSQCPDRTTCTPLLVGGEVIGSILADHPEPLGDQEQRAIREVVVQAAPVLSNLRNLAIAELRAATDSLTGLPNKRALDDTIKRMVAQSLRSGSPLVALMCDLDHFKSINDRFGHGHGDEVLAAVGAVLGDALRAGDLAGRYGGEEFLILLPDTDLEGGLLAAEKIRAGVAAVKVPSVDQAISLSIGLAVMPEHAIDPDTLARAADRALYAAKKAGRNRVEVCSAEVDPAVDRPPAPHPGVPVAASTTNGSH